MLMVQVRHMGMGMSGRRVCVPVAVRSCGHRIVRMVMMPVVMAMRVFVIQRRVQVLMLMSFAQMNNNASDHQQSADKRAPTQRAVTHQHRDRRPDERREGEHRPGASRAKSALRQQVHAKAEPIARGSNEQQADGLLPARERFAGKS